MTRIAALAAVLLTAGWISPTAQRSEVTVVNATGMAVIFLHLAGCGESEGNDWSEMDQWAYNYLEDDFMMPGDEFSLDLADGCYVMQPMYEDGTALMERVEVEGATRVVLTLG
ncbi:hypothetical protein [Rubrivirga sp.]|uniref:hypothetical protein n=1 Tax=Rubrivirga sp. TaxID=1885344 RepID=UPI003C775C62